MISICFRQWHNLVSSLAFFLIICWGEYTVVVESASMKSMISHHYHSVHLPIQDVNIVMVTDVHSWIGSHRQHEPHLDADYGHVLSFVQHLRNATSGNVLFVMNGDFMDGTGLSTYPPKFLTPILQEMPFDAMNVGNHELYHNSTVQHMVESGFLDQLGDVYITSNVMLSPNGNNESSTLLGGTRYKLLKVPSTNTTLLTFAFLYNMWDNCEMVQVEKVEEVVQSKWFIEALNLRTHHDSSSNQTSELAYDAILILAHMDVVDPLVTIILNAIRKHLPDTIPVQFITGHTHYRGHRTLDPYATSVEAGRYLDTVGFVSFNLDQDPNFEHVFIDANVKTLEQIVGMWDPKNENEFLTPDGRRIQQMIAQSRHTLGIDRRLGCSPRTFQLLHPLDKEDSLWGYFLKHVIQEYFFQNEGPNNVWIQSSGGFRYDLFEGNVTLDDIIAVHPFRDVLFVVASNITGSDLLKVFDGGKPNGGTPRTWMPEVPPYVTNIENVNPNENYTLFVPEFSLSHFVELVADVTGRSDIKPIPVHVNQNGTAIPVTVTDVWLNFVEARWQDCSHHDEKAKAAAAASAPSSSSPSRFPVVGFWSIAIITTVLVFVVSAWMSWHRRASRIRVAQEEAAKRIEQEQTTQHQPPPNAFELQGFYEEII